MKINLYEAEVQSALVRLMDGVQDVLNKKADLSNPDNRVPLQRLLDLFYHYRQERPFLVLDIDDGKIGELQEHVTPE
jgi:hypothetical protein